MELEVENISIDELIKIEGLSVRAQTVCYNYGLTDLKEILNFYYREKNGFSNLRNCGLKTNIELTNLCIKYEKYQIINNGEVLVFKDETIEIPVEDPIISKIDSLTIRQKQIINNIIKHRFSELSYRTSNALQSYLRNEINLKGIKSLILESDLRNIRNVGNKSIPEINSFIISTKEVIELVSNFRNNTEITYELFNSYLKSKFPSEISLIDEIEKKYDFSNGIPLFRTLDLLIEKEILFDHREKFIFKASFNYYNNNTIHTLEIISSKLNISRERTRQIRSNIYENLSEVFSFIRDLEFDALNLYGIDLNRDFIVVNDTIVEEINIQEGTNFNQFFINKVLSVLLHEKYTLLGDEKSLILETNHNSEHNWKSTYLVLNKYMEEFDFMKFVEDISRRLTERIEEDYFFHFQTYLLNFRKDKNKGSCEIVTEIIEYILINEFELIIDVDENIVFKRNIKKQVYEYAYEALENIGKPAKVDVIYKKVVELNPGIDIDESGIRASMKRTTGFVPFGRSSTFGLKIWEEKLDIRGGTIRDITEEFLQSNENPKHIDEITEYVNKYRNTNSKNIYSNLKIDESKRFVFFSGALIGLADKKYDPKIFIETKSIPLIKRTWIESFKTLDDFVQKNNRLPSPSGSEEESKLYRFLSIQLRKDRSKKLDIEKSNLINNMIARFKSHSIQLKIQDIVNNI